MDVLPVKMYSVVVGYTDLPLLEDETESNAKVREVDVVAYAPEMGCQVLWGGKRFTVPPERLYSEPGRKGEVPCLALEDLQTLPATVPE